MVAQISDGKIALGGLFDSFKVQINEYAEIINKFNKLDLSQRKYLGADGKANWEAIAKAIGTTDARAIGYFKTLDNGKGTIDNSSASVEGMSVYLKKTGQAFDFAALKAKLLDAALNAGIMIAFAAAIKAVEYAWDKANVTVQEVQGNIDDLSDSISTLEDEYNSLKDTGSENLTESEQARLQYLEDRIAREKELKELEEARLIREKYGNGFTEYFDEDNQNAKYSDFREKYFNGMSNMDVTSLAYGIEQNNQKVIDIGSKIDEYNASQEKIQSYIEQMNRHTPNEQEYIWADELKSQEDDKLEKLIPQLQEEYQNYKEAKYEAEAAIDEMTQDLDNPNLTNKDKETIQSWIAQYQDVIKIADYYIGVMRGIPAIPTDTDTDTYYNWYNKLSDDEKELANSDDFKKALEKQKTSLDDTTLSAENYAAALQDIKDAQDQTSDGSSSLSSTDILTQVQALSDGLDQLDKIYADVYNKEDFDWSSILNNDGFKEAFGNMTNVTEEYKNAYDDFIKTISNNPSDLSACQSAFDNLATAYIQNKGALDNLTDSEKQAAITMLEQMGIANAEEVVMASLVQKKLESTDASADLVTGTAEEINALITEGTVSEETAKKIAAYALHKQLCNGNTINTAADCENIIRLAQVAGAGTEALIKLEALKQRLADSPVMADEMRTNINNKIKDILSGVQSSATVSLKVPQAKYSGGTSTKSAMNKANKSSGSSSKDSKETKETFNWVETAISRVQRAVTNLGKIVSATYKSWSTRNSALSSEMSAVTQEISVQQSAYQAYMDKANSVGLSDYYKNLVQNGGISIEDVTDDTLKEQIQTYKEYYEKALAASDAVQDLRDNLAELAKTKFDNLAKKFENELDLIEHKSSMLDKYIDQTEKKGEIVSEHFYTTLIQNEQANVDKLQNEYNSLFNQLQDSLSTGGIEVYSDDWYEMVGQINDVEEALVDANSALVDYEKSLLKLRWDNFDYLRDCISDIISETEFLADLLDNKKLFDDSGHLNNYGESLGALYAIEYNTYMNQADEYAKAIDELNKAIAANPNDKDLLDRRQELYDAQREAIKNAESEKNAIKDLISDAYDAQLEALQKLIDKRKELLDATSDLYEYENTISEKTDAIASYQKQLQAYHGDNSEEGIANRQKIQTELEKAQKDLQQTEYEKWKSDQTAMLDDLYSEYETMLNSRLDDIDALVQDVINQSNANSVEIQGTIIDVANQVGYNISSDLQTILDTNNGMYDMVAFYNENFTGLLTTTNMSINGVTDRINTMISYSDSNAVNIINSINTAANNIVTASLQAASVYSSTIASLQSQLTLATIAANNNSSNHSGGSSGSSRSGGSSSSLKPGKTGGTIKKPHRTMTSNSGGSLLNHGWNIATRYANGGNVSVRTKSPFDDLAQSMGEDTMVAVKEGERILTPVQNEMWEQWTSSLPKLMDLSDSIKIPDFSKNVAQNATQSNINIGIDNIQMNGVNDPEKFTKQLVESVQQNGKVQSVLKDLTSNALLGKNSLRINKY